MKKLNLIIPMAGKGQRFIDAGYGKPKFLLEINGKTTIEWVVKSMNVPGAQLIFIIRQDHDKDYNLQGFLKTKFPDCNIVVIDHVTEGALCTVLLAEKLINNDTEAIIKDCDQIINWVPAHFLSFVRRRNADGAIVNIITQSPHYSFCKLGPDNMTIVETAEKKVISNLGTAGIYYFKKGSDLVKYGKQMIAKNIRTNNEFYVTPMYNELISDGKKILNYPIAEIFGLNTPDEFEQYKDEAVRIFEKVE
jgi:dTDP-glucose pyrophosphorylase